MNPSSKLIDDTENLAEYVGFVRAKLHYDYDNYIVIVGPEGVGKSDFGLQLGYAVSYETFNLENGVAYDPEDFIDAIHHAPRFGSVIADEGGETFMSNDANTIEGKNIKKALQQCRRKNLNMAIISPRHMYLNKMSLFRCHAFFYIYSRGSGTKYNPDIITLWQEGKRPWFSGPHDSEEGFEFEYRSLKERKPKVWAKYMEIKNKRGDERLDRYASEIREERLSRSSMNPEILLDEVRGMDLDKQLSLRNTRGRFDVDRIYAAFKSRGASQSICRAVSMDLNDELTDF